MSEFVRFDARFEYTDPETKQRTRYPAGWTGEVDPAVAEAARRVRALPPAAKSAADVTAAQKRVDDAEVALKAAKSEADKAKADSELKAAREALAKLEG